MANKQIARKGNVASKRGRMPAVQAAGADAPTSSHAAASPDAASPETTTLDSELGDLSPSSDFEFSSGDDEDAPNDESTSPAMAPEACSCFVQGHCLDCEHLSKAHAPVLPACR